MRLPSRVARSVGRFLRDRDGSATIEALIWVPVFTFLLGMIADASLMFGAKAEVLRVVQDANRSLSVGKFFTTAEAQDFVEERISEISPNATITTTVTSGVILTTVDMPSSDLTATGFFDGFAEITIRVQSHLLSEA